MKDVQRWRGRKRHIDEKKSQRRRRDETQIGRNQARQSKEENEQRGRDCIFVVWTGKD